MAPKKDFSSPSLLESHGAKQVFSAISSTPVSTAAPCVKDSKAPRENGEFIEVLTTGPKLEECEGPTIEPTLAEKIPSHMQVTGVWGEKTLEKFGNMPSWLSYSQTPTKRIAGQTGRVSGNPFRNFFGVFGYSWCIRNPKKRRLWKVATEASHDWHELSSWWFQPIWKILVKLGIFPK